MKINIDHLAYRCRHAMPMTQEEHYFVAALVLLYGDQYLDAVENTIDVIGEPQTMKLIAKQSAESNG